METIIELLDYILIFLIALYAVSGARHGFLCSAANTGSVALSWVMAANLYPMLAKNLVGSGFYTFIQYMTEVTDNVSNIELAKTGAADLTAEQMAELPSYANLPGIYADRFMENIESLAFDANGLYTVSEYLNQTIAAVTLNILCFLIVYVVIRLLFMLVISTFNFASPFPVLKHLDPVAGGALGAIRGFMAMFGIAMITPAVLVLVTGTEISKLITDSAIISFFYNNNMLFDFISGAI